MRVNFAHMQHPSTTGQPINFAVFDARSNSGLDADNAELLASLTMSARSSGLRIDQSALAYQQDGRTRFYGTKALVEFLSRNGPPRWTHSIDV